MRLALNVRGGVLSEEARKSVSGFRTKPAQEGTLMFTQIYNSTEDIFKILIK